MLHCDSDGKVISWGKAGTIALKETTPLLTGRAQNKPHSEGGQCRVGVGGCPAHTRPWVPQPSTARGGGQQADHFPEQGREAAGGHSSTSLHQRSFNWESVAEWRGLVHLGKVMQSRWPEPRTLPQPGVTCLSAGPRWEAGGSAFSLGSWTRTGLLNREAAGKHAELWTAAGKVRLCFLRSPQEAHLAFLRGEVREEVTGEEEVTGLHPRF